MHKKELYKICQKYLNSNSIKMLVLFVPIVFLAFQQIKDGEFEYKNILDVSIFVSLVLYSFCELIARVLSKIIGEKLEDFAKLQTDYELLVKKYTLTSTIRYNSPKTPCNAGDNIFDTAISEFPVILLSQRHIGDSLYEIIIDDIRSKKYNLPSQIASNSNDLMEAHKYSNIYNNINIRLDNIIIEQNKVTLFSSRTTYYDSLITNRAMDYDLTNGKTIREIFEPGPYLNALSDSKLSNHLGFNGFVETSDNKIVFVLRDNHLSIGKGTLGNSIGASLKTKYALDDKLEFTVKGLDNAIRQEIKDELGISVDAPYLYNDIIAFYRDIVEGGKPQFLFYTKLRSMSSEELKQEFQSKIKTRNKKKKNSIQDSLALDGKVIYFLTLDELKRSTIFASKLILPYDVANRIGKKEFAMMPSASASIVMLLNYHNHY